ncbi:MAG: DUF4124 domain-containing protein [Deltaproteobacteria bacterium]|nr:DUF4124 domain-containing protein [Deltaproteobacteria bacterium]
MKSKALEVILIIAFVLILDPFSASAETYKWTDDEGVIHVTDDPTKVPDKYWEQEKVKKEEVKTAPETKPAQPVQQPPGPETEKRELYGDYPLDWWVYKFKALRKDIADTEEDLGKKQDFIAFYVRGRIYGILLTKDEASRFEQYRTEIPVIEEKLKKLKDELEELQRKATIYGVPRNIRE